MKWINIIAWHVKSLFYVALTLHAKNCRRHADEAFEYPEGCMVYQIGFIWLAFAEILEDLAAAVMGIT